MKHLIFLAAFLVLPVHASTTLSEYEIMKTLAKKDVVIRKRLHQYVKGLMDGIYIANIYAEKKLFCSEDAMDTAKYHKLLQDEIDSHYYMYSRDNTPVTHIAIRALQAKFPCK